MKKSNLPGIKEALPGLTDPIKTGNPQMDAANRSSGPACLR